MITGPTLGVNGDMGQARYPISFLLFGINLSQSFRCVIYFEGVV